MLNSGTTRSDLMMPMSLLLSLSGQSASAHCRVCSKSLAELSPPVEMKHAYFFKQSRLLWYRSLRFGPGNYSERDAPVPKRSRKKQAEKGKGVHAKPAEARDCEELVVPPKELSKPL